VVGGAQQFANVIANFGTDDVLDLDWLPFERGATAVVSGTTLTVNSGTNSQKFVLDSPPPVAFKIFADADGSSKVLRADAVPCFVQGTLIRTTNGDVAVEDLRVGDRVITLDGPSCGHRPVIWIGRRHLDLSRHRDPAAARPIRILPHALDDHVPDRELRVSPDHAMAIEGLLIPARLLVNGATIRRDDRAVAVDYFHIETDRHSILLAENAPTESYLDTGNRGLFENGGAPLILHPDLASLDGQQRRGAESCLPFTTAPVDVKPLWRRLADRAVCLGHTLPQPVVTQDAEPVVIAGDRTIRPILAGPDRYRFILPSGQDSVRLVSRASAPADLAAWAEDRRRLGLCVHRIQVREGARLTDLAMDHPDLSQGWWPVERHGQAIVRWTNGDALLPVGAGEVPILEITAASLEYYVLPDDPETAEEQDGVTPAACPFSCRLTGR